MDAAHPRLSRQTPLLASDNARLVRRARASAKRAMQEARCLSQALLSGSAAPRVAFFEQNGSPSQLRCARMAEHLRGYGWSALSLPAGLGIAQRRRVLRLFAPDLVVLQKCRHPGDRVEHLAPFAFVLDIDDADFLDPALSEIMRDVARSARGVIAGSQFLADWARPLNPATEVVWTGSEPTPGPHPPHDARAPIVTWAQASPMRYRNEFDFVCAVLRAVKAAGADFRFRLYGCTGTAEERAAIAPLEAAGIPVESLAPMEYGRFLHSLRDCAVGLSAISPDSPYSQGKSFGKILGYLDAKVPVICSDAADHAAFFFSKPTGSDANVAPPQDTPELGFVTNDEDAWRDAIVALLKDPARRQRISDAAHHAFVHRLSLDAAARRTDRVLRAYLRAPVSAHSGVPAPPTP